MILQSNLCFENLTISIVVTVWVPSSLIVLSSFVFNFRFAGAGTAAAMQPGVPVYTAILGVLVGVERISFLMVVGLLLTVSGSLIMTDVWDVWESVDSRRETIGVMMLLVQGMCWATYTVTLEWVVNR